MIHWTSIEQGKLLEEILPEKSRDMYVEKGLLSMWKYEACLSDDYFSFKRANLGKDKIVPAWSLVGLLEGLPKIINGESLFIEASAALWHVGYRNIYIARNEDLVDACVELIEKLHKEGLL